MGNFDTTNDLSTLTGVFNERKDRAKKVLVSKAKEYAFTNRYDNFLTGSDLTGKTPAQVLFGFQLKHLISLVDISEDRVKDREVIEEKIMDSFNYCVILRGLLDYTQDLNVVLDEYKTPKFLKGMEKKHLVLKVPISDTIYQYSRAIESGVRSNITDGLGQMLYLCFYMDVIHGLGVTDEV